MYIHINLVFLDAIYAHFSYKKLEILSNKKTSSKLEVKEFKLIFLATKIIKAENFFP